MYFWYLGLGSDGAEVSPLIGAGFEVRARFGASGGCVTFFGSFCLAEVGSEQGGVTGSGSLDVGVSDLEGAVSFGSAVGSGCTSSTVGGAMSDSLFSRGMLVSTTAATTATTSSAPTPKSVTVAVPSAPASNNGAVFVPVFFCTSV